MAEPKRGHRNKAPRVPLIPLVPLVPLVLSTELSFQEKQSSGLRSKALFSREMMSDTFTKFRSLLDTTNPFQR